jgi:hypothetical protein
MRRPGSTQRAEGVDVSRLEDLRTASEAAATDVADQSALTDSRYSTFSLRA